MKRQRPSRTTERNMFLFRYEVTCAVCRERILPGQPIEIDHIQALCHEGDNEFKNLRPLHVACHKAKTAKDVKANAKVKRLRGETGGGIKKAIPKRADPWGRKWKEAKCRKKSLQA